LEIPDGVAESEVEDRERADATAAETLPDEKHPRPAAGGLRRYRLNDSPWPVSRRQPAELDRLLRALPLYEWMRTFITPLVEHPNDPARIREIA
jgi:muconolactone delta-isomerase